MHHLAQQGQNQYKYELHKACFEGDLEIFQRIITKPNSNINLNLKNKLGLTALDRAIEGKREEIIKTLLNDVRCNINTGGGDKRSTLNFSVHILNIPAIKSILNSSKFVDFNIVDDKGNNVFHILMDKYYGDSSSKCESILDMLFENIAPCHQYLFTQYNHDMLSPLHCAVRSRNKFAVCHLLALTKKYNHFSERIMSIPVGYDEYPLIHFFGIVLKGYESEYILRRNPEIDILARDHRGIPATLFEYFCNNNSDNHKRWFLYKHFKRIYAEKFLKPQNNYKRIIQAEREYTRVACMKNRESQYHTYTQVLSHKNNNILWKRKQMFKKPRKKFKKMLQKEIEYDNVEEICVEFSEEKAKIVEYASTDRKGTSKTKYEKYAKFFNSKNSHSDTEEEDSEDTTAAGPGTINNLLNNMNLNPRKKMEIDTSQDLLGKSENISITCDHITEEKVPSKSINFFTKSSPKMDNGQAIVRRMNSTQFREIQGENRIMIDRKILDLYEITEIKRKFTLSNSFQKSKRELFRGTRGLQKNQKRLKSSNLQILFSLLLQSPTYHIQKPTWSLLIDILLNSPQKEDLQKINSLYQKLENPTQKEKFRENFKEEQKGDLEGQEWLKGELEMVKVYFRKREEIIEKRVRQKEIDKMNRNGMVIRNQLPKSIVNSRRPYRRRNNLTKIHSALEMYDNKSFNLPLERYRNVILKERSTIGPKDRIDCKTLSQVKEMSIQTKSARLIKPRQKHVADSFLFNNGVGFNIPNLNQSRLTPQIHHGRKTGLRIKIDLN